MLVPTNRTRGSDVAAKPRDAPFSNDKRKRAYLIRRRSTTVNSSIHGHGRYRSRHDVNI